LFSLPFTKPAVFEMVNIYNIAECVNEIKIVCGIWPLFQPKQIMSPPGGLGSDRESENAAFVSLARRGSVSSGTPKTRVEERIKFSVHGICPVGELF